MEQDNKNRIVKGAKILALTLFALITIATCVGVWNFCKEPLVKWCAGILMAVNAVAIYVIAKNTMFKY